MKIEPIKKYMTPSTKTLKIGSHNVAHTSGSSYAVNTLIANDHPEHDLYILITDDRVNEIYAKWIEELNSSLKNLMVFSIGHGEESKTAENYLHMCNKLIQAGATRRSCIISFGGGVTLNLAGMIASSLYRGIKLIHIPTTFIAMHDVSISIKQAVNLESGKNLLGTYYAPKHVYLDTSFVLSLPEREYKCGLGELLKTLIVCDPTTCEDLVSDNDEMNSGNLDVFLKWIDKSINMKIELIKNDDQERSSALTLEYGHTLGHALEALQLDKQNNEGLSHGEAISIGMIFAARIVEALDVKNNPNLVSNIEDFLTRLNLQTKIPKSFNQKDVLTKMLFDNKKGHISTTNATVPMVLISDFGKPLYTENKPIYPVSVSLLQSVVKNMY